jgi:hypothetical protein
LPARLFSLWRGETFEDIRDGNVGEISQFTGVKIRTVTRTAGLIPDMGLFIVYKEIDERGIGAPPKGKEFIIKYSHIFDVFK